MYPARFEKLGYRLTEYEKHVPIREWTEHYYPPDTAWQATRKDFLEHPEHAEAERRYRYEMSDPMIEKKIRGEGRLTAGCDGPPDSDFDKSFGTTYNKEDPNKIYMSRKATKKMLGIYDKGIQDVVEQGNKVDKNNAYSNTLRNGNITVRVVRK